MKNIYLIITFGIIGLIATEGIPENSATVPERDVVFELDTSFYEIGKTAKFSIEDKQFKSAPQWNDSEAKALPVSMENAIRVAKDFLVSIGCARKNYYLYECSLQRLYRFDSSTQWYWKVSFGDDSFIASLDPIVTIPVMMDGKVSSYELKPLEIPQPE
jgi:hypothetical protein